MSTENYYRSIPSKECYIKGMNSEQWKEANKYGYSTSFSRMFFPGTPIRHERNEEYYEESNEKLLSRSKPKI